MNVVRANRAIAVACAVALTTGCVHHKGFSAPSEAKALALFQQDLAAAERHDAKALCASAEESELCQMDLEERPFPRLSDVHTGGQRLVDANRVVRVCGKADGVPFASDFPVTQDPQGRLGAINPVFWTPMHFIPKPSQGAPVSIPPPTQKPTQPPAVDC
jgi:hypothetical protein